MGNSSIRKGLDEPERIRGTKKCKILKETWEERNHVPEGKLALERKRGTSF